MKFLYGIVVLCAVIWFMKSRKSQLTEGQVSNENLAKDEKIITWILCFLWPIFAGGILYYGWRKKLPAKARQANSISWVVFLIGTVVYVFVHYMLKSKIM